MKTIAFLCVSIILISSFLFSFIFCLSNDLLAWSTQMNKTENVTLANPIDNRSLGLNNNISIPKLAIEDIAETSSMVAEELKEKTPDELYIYPLSDLSAAEIEKALKGLSPADLERVLVNISPETFDEIMHFKLSQDKVDEIINMLPLEKRQGILNRVS